MVLMLIIAGMATSLAIYFLLSGVLSYEPRLDAEMVHEIGITRSIFVFAFCGPILVLKLCFDDDGRDTEETNMVGFIATICIAAFWSAVIGVVATQSVQAAIMPSITPIIAQF